MRTEHIYSLFCHELGRRTRSPKPPYRRIPRCPSSGKSSNIHYHSITPDSSMVYEPQQPGTIVVNVGDLLSRWSNDILRSTLHRVVAPPAKQISETEQITPARQSIAFFCNPNGGALIDCLPNCYGPDRAKKYEPVTTEQYIVSR